MTRASAAQFTNMHDFLLAKEIIDEILKIAKDKKLANIKSVKLEIGSVSLSHDNFPEHAEDINLENLRFGLENIAKNTLLKEAKFDIKKAKGINWSIINIIE
jgi:Zn finger protein HypA/HybF involved in hydrogenase expression